MAPREEVARNALSSSRTIRLASLALMVATICALGAVAFFTERGVAASRDWVIHTYQVRTQLSDLQLELMQAVSNPMTGQQAGLAKPGASARQSARMVRNLTRDNPRQQARLDRMDPLLNDVVSLVGTRPAATGLREQLPPQEQAREQQIRDLGTQINGILAEMQSEEQNLLAERLREWNYLFKRNVFMLGLAFAIVTVMLGYNFWLLTSEVGRTRDREELVRGNAESYRLMSAKILELQDSERRKIARELHDSVGQFLAGLKINLVQLEMGTRVDRAALIHETIELTDYAIQEVRTISHLLHPPLLDELGFLPAARWYVDEYGKRSQVQTSLSIEESIGRLPRAIEIALFRVLQETLTNVYRHAGAHKVDIRISRENGHVRLTVADDGKGIPQHVLARFYKGAAPGIGLAGMRERLAEFGGEMQVHSSSAGSVVEAVIPTKASQQG